MVIGLVGIALDRSPYNSLEHGMPRPSDARERLIRAAMKLFRQRGYDGVGLTEILTEADAPKGSFYHHFPGGKEQLGAAAVLHAGQFIGQLIEAEFGQAASFMEGVERVANGIAAGFERSAHRDGCPITGIALDMVPRSAMISDAVRKAFSEWQDIVVAHARRLGELEITADDALRLIMLLEGAWIMARVHADSGLIRIAGQMFRKQHGMRAASSTA
jgi:TetR/AcrR family transcriptional regulator, lmrAB and yxaGH operons repressor